MNNVIEVELIFQEHGFSKEEMEVYRRYFEDLGEVRTQTYEQPAAGATFGLIVIAKFVAGAIASGVVYDALKGLSVRLLKVFRDRKKQKRHLPETSVIQLEFSNATLLLGSDDRGRYSPDEFSIHEKVIEKMDEIAAQVASHLGSPPLKDAAFKFLHVPVRAAQESATAALVGRNWKMSAERHTKYGYGLYYDSTARTLFEIKEAPPVPAESRG